MKGSTWIMIGVGVAAIAVFAMPHLGKFGEAFGFVPTSPTAPPGGVLGPPGARPPRGTQAIGNTAIPPSPKQALGDIGRTAGTSAVQYGASVLQNWLNGGKGPQ